jgi:hypothetical protein
MEEVWKTGVTLALAAGFLQTSKNHGRIGSTE